MTRCPGGFTLVEILVATAILALVTVMLSSILASVSRAWISGEQSVECYQNGRAILDLVARDLSPAAISGSLQFVQNPGDPTTGLGALLSGSGSVQATNSDSLFWQSPYPGNSVGNICEAGYYLTRNAGLKQYQLQRFFVQPDSLATTDPNHSFRIYDAPVNAMTAPWLTLLKPAAFQTASSIVSDGVIAFWVRCLDKNGDPILWLGDSSSTAAQAYAAAQPMKFNSAAGFVPAITGVPNSFQYTDPTSTTPANRLPTSVEISLVTLDSRTLKRLATIPDMPACSAAGKVPDAIQQFMSTLTANRITTARLFSTSVRLVKGTD